MAYLTLTPNELYRPGQLFVVRESPVPGLRDVDLVVRVIERWQWVHRPFGEALSQGWRTFGQGHRATELGSPPMLPKGCATTVLYSNTTDNRF